PLPSSDSTVQQSLSIPPSLDEEDELLLLIHSRGDETVGHPPNYDSQRGRGISYCAGDDAYPAESSGGRGIGTCRRFFLQSMFVHLCLV
ncbi:hypothetical protein LINPERPRIM_LOCUS38098, partial [Linum perenne]